MTIAQSSRSTLDHIRQRLGNRYTIERELGRGGMGVVYLARDLQLDRLVALKVLPQEFAVQPMLRERFLRETRLVAGFSHPNIVPVYAVEETDDLLAYAMGLVEGESLVERVRRAGALPVAEIVRLMQDVGYALAYAHGHGVVHRDIKPDNIMIERASGRALVMDFGIARAAGSKSAVSAGLTRVGEVVGTPEYMSPEQATGDDIDGRSDLYSLGLTVHFAALAKTAMSAESMQRVLAKQITEVLPPIREARPDLPEALANAVDLTLRKDPGERFESAAAMVDALSVAQLAVPEIPLAIRLFAQEAGTLSMIAIGIVMLIVFLNNAASERAGDMQLLSSLLIVVLLTRVAQTFGEAKRLSVAGFSPGDITRGLNRVVDEREQRRSELRKDTTVVAERRGTVLLALALLAGAAITFRGAMLFRHETRPGMYNVELPGLALLACCIVMFGIGVVQLLKSPLRMPLGERLFRLVWIGFPGRAFFQFAGRKHQRRNANARHHPTSKNTVAHEVATPAAKQRPASLPAAVAVPLEKFDALEARVATIESLLDADAVKRS
ncbi:MAG: serine/threonine protein kinase [Gemmatimonadota bacterium]|nr:serine/threonine protein kinase [Gemmatimonadota bacterium]